MSRVFVGFFKTIFLPFSHPQDMPFFPYFIYILWLMQKGETVFILRFPLLDLLNCFCAMCN